MVMVSTKGINSVTSLTAKQLLGPNIVFVSGMNSLTKLTAKAAALAKYGHGINRYKM